MVVSRVWITRLEKQNIETKHWCLGTYIFPRSTNTQHYAKVEWTMWEKKHKKFLPKIFQGVEFSFLINQSHLTHKNISQTMSWRLYKPFETPMEVVNLASYFFLRNRMLPFIHIYFPCNWLRPTGWYTRGDLNLCLKQLQNGTFGSNS